MPDIVQDTIKFTVRAERVIVNDTVKIKAHVTALISSDTPEDTLRSDIRATMKKFIASAEWQFSNMERGSDPTGFERVTLIATARVPEAENYNLDTRARDASRQGLTITHPGADTSVPLAKIEEAEIALRADIIQKVMTERDQIRALTGQAYRIGTIDFGSVGDAGNGRSALLASALTVTKASYGSGFGGDDALGNASKLTMQAAVTLANTP